MLNVHRHRISSTRRLSALSAAALLTIGTAFAGDAGAQSVWLAPASGNWSDNTVTGWNGTGVPNSAGATATISFAIQPQAVGTFTVTPDGTTPFTLGSLTTGDTATLRSVSIGATGATNGLIFDSGSASTNATLTQVATALGDSYFVPFTLNSNLTITNSSAANLMFVRGKISDGTSGAKGVVIAPTGGIRPVRFDTAANTSTFSGGFTVQNGAAVKFSVGSTAAGGAVTGGPTGVGPFNIQGGIIYGGADVVAPTINISNDFKINEGTNPNAANGRLGLGGTIDLGGATRTATLGLNATGVNAALGAPSMRFNAITNGPAVVVQNGTLKLIADAGVTYTGAVFQTQGTFVNNAGLTLGDRVAMTFSTSTIFNTAATSTPSVTLEGDSYFITSNAVSGRNPTIHSLSGTSGTILNLQTSGTGTALINTVTINPNAGVSATFGGTIKDTDTALLPTAIGQIAITKGGAGTQALTGTNSYSGTTTVSGGVLRATPGVGLPNGSLLTLNGGVIETSADLVRTGGAAAGNMQITGGTSGFSVAGGGTVNVAYGSLASPTPLVWGTTAGFTPNQLVLNADTASGTLNFRNDIDFSSATSRTINVNGGTAIISGVLSNSNATPSFINKGGAGTLVLNSPNTFAGNFSINGGVVSTNLLAAIDQPSGIGTKSFTIQGGGTLRYTGPTVTTNKTINLGTTGGASGGLDASGTGPVTFTGGIGGNSTSGARTLNLSGSNTGDNTLGGALGDLRANTSDTFQPTSVRKTGAGKWVLSGSTTYTGSTTVEAGTLQFGANAGNNVLTNAGGLDVKGGKAVLAYDAGGSAALQATLVPLLQTAAASNFATGQVRSTTSTSSRTLGWKDDGASAISLVPTLFGDATLDLTVNFDDLLKLAANYNASGKVWADGDFNYDGTVNFDDLLKLAANYNQTLSGSFAGDWALAQSAVPEPTSLAVVAAFAGAALRRRRRHA
jgi:fibronectin-binding autotransporter adhesin